MFANNLIICNTWKIFLTGKYSFQEKIITSRSSSPPLKRTSEDLHLHLKISIFKIFYITFFEGKISFPGKDLPSRRTSSFQENIFFPGKDLLNIELEILYFFVFVDHQFWSTIVVCSWFGKGSELWCRTLKGSKLRLLELEFIRKGAPVFNITVLLVFINFGFDQPILCNLSLILVL